MTIFPVLIGSRYILFQITLSNGDSLYGIGSKWVTWPVDFRGHWFIWDMSRESAPEIRTAYETVSVTDYKGDIDTCFYNVHGIPSNHSGAAYPAIYQQGEGRHCCNVISIISMLHHMFLTQLIIDISYVELNDNIRSVS